MVDMVILQQFVKSSKTIVKRIVQLAVKCKCLNAYCHDDRLESIHTFQSRDSQFFFLLHLWDHSETNAHSDGFVLLAGGLLLMNICRAISWSQSSTALFKG
jgi:hypothetical protein